MNTKAKIALAILLFLMLCIMFTQHNRIKQLEKKITYVDMWLGGERIPYSFAEEQGMLD